MESYRLLLALEDVSAAGSLATWLRRQGAEVSFVVSDESMGSSEVLCSTIAGTAALRAFVAIAQEWIRAHRTSISVQVEGRGSFVVEGTTDIDQLVHLLQSVPSQDDSPEGAEDA